MDKVILKTDFNKLKLFKRGKVRDIYDLGEFYLLISTDRISAYDVIMNQGIPGKGKILTKISEFWFDFTKDIIESHFVSTDVGSFPSECRKYAEDLEGRSMLVEKAELIPIECIVRGYITGSGWNDYQKTGQICGIELPKGLVESEKLQEPIFTPSTKAEIGAHDENISSDRAMEIVGEETFNAIKSATINIFKKASDYAFEKGIIIADTKFEFGFYNGKIILIDEVLTPDSSRFWSRESYEKGQAQFSYDKQYVRDYLTSINFNKKPPAPNLPEDVIKNTLLKYKEAQELLTESKP
ncbi:MAG: phosphoribosylaminoimidazolesuccinocarboxamide synthase [Bacteroidetes bacterium]|nr:phosphoribosylaminoimidazolesuccinocarboxamide synthase [Bacteroidota bacterium]MBU2507879.1 phosphoribosylaminoimidazolesuccinocarboxamide synthase [Bacteroidota bacterium]